jgi:hypothetical protein
MSMKLIPTHSQQKIKINTPLGADSHAVTVRVIDLSVEDETFQVYPSCAFREMLVCQVEHITIDSDVFVEVDRDCDEITGWAILIVDPGFEDMIFV